MSTGAFAIKTDTFEGPLELLIELVEKRKLLINDISLAEVTDEYMQAVSAMQEHSLPNTAQFVSLAATLLLIKSKSLLPVLELTNDEEESIDNLAERLRLYQLYRDAGEAIQLQFGANTLYTPEYKPPREPLFTPDTHCTTASLQAAMERVLGNLPQSTNKPKAQVKPTISLEEMMLQLRSRIEQQLQTTFFAMQNTEPEHKNVIVGFLAILELFKQGNVIITQDNRFADIHIQLAQAETPRYY